MNPVAIFVSLDLRSFSFYFSVRLPVSVHTLYAISWSPNKENSYLGSICLGGLVGKNVCLFCLSVGRGGVVILYSQNYLSN